MAINGSKQMVVKARINREKMGMNVSRVQIPYSGGGCILKFPIDRYITLHNIFFLFNEFLLNLTTAQLRGNLPRSQYTCFVHSRDLYSATHDITFMRYLCRTYSK